MSADVRSESKDPPPELSEQESSNSAPEAQTFKVLRPKGKTKAKSETHRRFNPEQQTLT